MISSDVQNYLKSLIKTYSEQGYYNYLAHSYTRRYNEQEYNLVVYLSKDDITNSSLYTFNVSGDSLVYCILTLRVITTVNILQLKYRNITVAVLILAIMKQCLLTVRQPL